MNLELVVVVKWRFWTLQTRRLDSPLDGRNCLCQLENCAASLDRCLQIAHLLKVDFMLVGSGRCFTSIACLKVLLGRVALL